MEWGITTYLHKATSLYKFLFLECYHQIGALFIYTAPKNMLRIWVQKQAGCRKEAFFSLTEPRLCTSTVNIPLFLFIYFFGGSSYTTEHCSLSLGSEDWQVLLDTVSQVQSMITVCQLKNTNNIFQRGFPSVLFERNSSPEHPL